MNPVARLVPLLALVMSACSSSGLDGAGELIVERQTFDVVLTRVDGDCPEGIVTSMTLSKAKYIGSTVDGTCDGESQFDGNVLSWDFRCDVQKRWRARFELDKDGVGRGVSAIERTNCAGFYTAVISRRP